MKKNKKEAKGARVEYSFSSDRIEAVAHRDHEYLWGEIVMVDQKQTSDKELCDLARRMGEAEKKPGMRRSSRHCSRTK